MATGKNTTEPSSAVAELPRVDEAIAGVERFYQSLTGSLPPPPVQDESSPIPVEMDPAEFLSERLERLIDALSPAPRVETTWSPPLTLWEDGHELTLLLDLSGVEKQDLRLVDEGESLVVSGQRRASYDGKKLKMSERPLGPFRRTILLPRGVSGSEASARLRDGLLEIRIPKSASPAGSRAINVG
jgi:HSP20 family protein